MSSDVSNYHYLSHNPVELKEENKNKNLFKVVNIENVSSNLLKKNLLNNNDGNDNDCFKSYDVCEKMDGGKLLNFLDNTIDNSANTLRIDAITEESLEHICADNNSNSSDVLSENNANKKEATHSLTKIKNKW